MKGKKIYFFWIPDLAILMDIAAIFNFEREKSTGSDKLKSKLISVFHWPFLEEIRNDYKIRKLYEQITELEPECCNRIFKILGFNNTVAWKHE